MRWTSGVLALVLVGCGAREAEKPDDQMVGEAAGMEEAPATISLADVAGTWSVRGTMDGNESTVVTYDLVATGDESGWATNFPGRDPVPARVVAVEGDSIVTESGPFESVLRKGVQVRTRGVSRLQDGKLVGKMVASYDVPTADSVATFTFEATRKP